MFSNFDRDSIMRLITVVNKVEVEIDLPGVTESVYEAAGYLLENSLKLSGIKNREAIASAFLYLLEECPEANASDLWHHIIYRQYCEVLPRHRPQDPKQSWVRASGEALELAICQWYTPVLSQYGIIIKALIGRNEKREALEAMGILETVGSSKLDVALYLEIEEGCWQIFGSVHVKASLAERVSDDIPTSRAMMGSGYFSPLWTMDVKSFPPPQGDLINRGELGSPASPSDKRKYIEEHGDFDGCYSGNSRTVPSKMETTSGKKIYTLDLSDQPDRFTQDVIERAAQFRSLRLREP